MTQIGRRGQSESGWMSNIFLFIQRPKFNLRLSQNMRFVKIIYSKIAKK